MSTDSIRDLKSRIKGVKNIQQITNAMKMVAAARIKKAEKHVKSLLPYAEKLKELTVDLVPMLEEPHPLVIQRKLEKIGILVFTTEKGLCGAFNSDIMKAVEKLLCIHKTAEPVLIPVGGRGIRYFQKRMPQCIYFSYTLESSTPSVNDAVYLTEKLTKAFMDRVFEQLYVVHAKYLSTTRYHAGYHKLLPLEKSSKSTVVDYILEPELTVLVDVIFPKFLETQIYQFLLENAASEQGARLIAMTNATDNAGELISELTLSYYKARQESITKEILEVAGGAEALNR